MRFAYSPFLFSSRLLAVALLAVPAAGDSLAAGFQVTNTADSGPGSLRQAILDANASPGADTVDFAFSEQPGTYPVILVTGSLPDIADPLTIVGKHQSSGPWGTVSVEGVEIRSAGMNAGQSLLTVTAGSTTLKNLAFGSNTPGTIGITLSGQGNNLLEALQVGITYQNLLPSEGLHGMVVASDDNTVTLCRIGGATGGAGIRITGNRNTVTGCSLGLKPTGSGAQRLAANQTGIHLVGGAANVIGVQAGTTGRNQISASYQTGLHIEGGTGHRIWGNNIDPHQMDQFGFNGTGSAGHGILVDSAASDILIAGALVMHTQGNNIHITGGAEDVTIRGGSGSEISMPRSLGSSNIFLGDTGSVTIEGCNIWSSGFSGILMAGSAGAASGPILIRHNSFASNLTAIQVVSGMGKVTIGSRRNPADPVSNTFKSNQLAGIVIRDPGAVVTITENAIQPYFSFGSEIYVPVNLQPDGEAPNTITPNDPLDADTGPNGLQNKPFLGAVVPLTGSNIRLDGSLHAMPSTTYRIEAHQYKMIQGFPSTSFDAAYIGSMTVTTDAAGEALISWPVTGYVAGWKVALTATSPEGQTSEYSNDLLSGSSAPLFPLLEGQTAISLPESESAIDFAFSLMRREGLNGAFNASIGVKALFTRDTFNPAPRPPLKYRFSPADAWTNLNWDGTLTIPFTALDNQRIIYLAAYDDISWDPANKPAELSINPGPGTSPKLIPLQFPDNDPPPVFTAINFGHAETPTNRPAAYYENSSEMPMIRFIADRPVSARVNYTISLNTAQSTAIQGQDFLTNELPFQTTLFEAGLIMNNFAVHPIDDEIVEADKVIAFNVVSTTPGIIYNAVVPLIIQDNDFHQISIGDVSVVEGDAGTKMLGFPVTISQTRSSDVALAWSTSPDTAVSPSDFTAASGMVTIAAGTTSAVINIEVIGDMVVEASEFFTVTLADPGLDDVRLADASAVGTITNDDFPSVSLASAAISEAAGSVTLTATLSGPAPFVSTVGYTLVNGNATRFNDFNGSVTGTLTFPAGSTTATLALTIINDTIDEPDETFTVQLGSPSSLTIGTGTATVTILDDDMPVLLNPTVVNIVEGDSGSQVITVTLSLGSAAIREGAVNWQVTAGSTAVEAAGGTLHFGVGATTASLTLSLPGDLIPQAVRTVKLALSNPVEITLPVAEMTVATITDNDQRVLRGSAISLAEGTGGTTIVPFVLSIPAPLAVPVTVNYETAGGTALAGSDFAMAGGTATIPAGATEITIFLEVMADAVLETNESFTLQLSNPGNATLAATSYVITLTNDDAQPTLDIVPATTVTTGPGGPFRAWIEVRLPADATSLAFPLAYRVATRDDTALSGTHYTGISQATLTFPPGNGTVVSQWIAIDVAGTEGSNATPIHFHVDFTPVSGPATPISTVVGIEPLRVTNFDRLGLGFYTVSFPTGIAQNYVIQQAASLAGPWTDKTSVIPGSGNPVEEYLLFSSQPRAYFRVRSFTSPPATPAVLTP